MRFLLLIAFFCWSKASISQVYPRDKLKLSIKFGNSVQMAFDVVNRKHDFNTETEAKIENGDFQFYRSHYKRSINYYHEAFENLVGSTKNDDSIDVFSISRRKDKRFTRAEKLLKLVGSKELTPNQWMDLASVINNLGIYYHQVGNLVVAEKLFLKALEIRGKEAGKTSEHYVVSLHNLAVLRADQGRYNAAEDILKYVIRYYGKKTSVNSYQYAIALNNQSMLYAQLGRKGGADSKLKSILNNPTINFPNHSLDRARIMMNGALLEIENEHFEGAESFLLQALKVYKEKGFTNHSDYHQIRLLLAQVYLSQGKLTSLNEYIEGTLKEIGKDIGTDNLAYSYALEVKAEYLFEANNYAMANELYEQITRIRAAKLGVLHKDYIRIINKTAISHWKLGNNQEAFDNFINATNSYLEVVDKFFYNMSEVEKTKFWQTLKPELDVFYSFVSDQYELIPALIPAAYNLRMRTKGLLIHNSNQVRLAIYEQSDDELTKKYKDWLSLREILSGYYSMDKETIKIMGTDVSILESESNELEKELNRLVSTGLTENDKITTYEEVKQVLEEDQAAVEIMRVSNRYNTDIKSDEYVAFVVTKNQGLKLIAIGEANELESKMSVYYKNMIKYKLVESLTYKKFWEPIQMAIEGKNKVSVSLDGVYNLINLRSLKNEKEQYLVDLLTIDIVPNTKFLTRNSQSKIDNQDYVLIGNPVFGDPSIAPLPGTARELEVIQTLLSSSNTKVFSQRMATEEVLKKIESPKVLHVATHGFFLGEVTKSNTLTLSRSVANSNPLMRSGLLLSGAGKSPSKGLNESISDGIFTAYEAMNLKLQNTDLVILSACETGTGEVVNGEGVYGLSRAFTIAGAQHLIMSLWKVDDQATMELMTIFYKDWLINKDLKSAFNRAQQQVKKKYKDPYYWAAFVLIDNL